MKVKNLLPLTAAAMFALTACTVTVEDDSIEPESSSSVERVPVESSSSNYDYTSRIDQVEKTAKTYCDTKAENAGLNGYVDASISGFGTIAVTITQDMSAHTMETILEMKVDAASDDEFKEICDDLIDEEDTFSSCNQNSKVVTTITNQGMDHVLNNTTMTKLLDGLCEDFVEFGEEDGIPADTTYAYPHLTYCEIYEGATPSDSTYYDCEELPVKKVPAATVSIKNIDDEHFTVGAYFGDEDDKGIIEDTYTLVGFDSDELGSYWEFTGEEDIVRVYGGDFTVMRAKDDSYYYSWSQWDELYKKLAKKYKAIKK